MEGQLIASKPRYEILDGLRGVAALVVVAYHLMEAYCTNYTDIHVNHGYMAVDFFYALSGFVIGYAYDDRWGKMSLGGFFRRRLIRLHPMLIFGVITGLVLFKFQACSDYNLIDGAQWWMVLALAALNIIMIPQPNCWDIRGTREFSSLDGPSWTLFYEYWANILYALIFRKLPKFALALCVAAVAVTTIDIAFNINMFGFLDDYENIYAVNGGWSLTGTSLYVGFSRLLLPFLSGLLISRCGKFIHLRGGFWWCALIIVFLLTMPFLGREGSMWVEGLYDSVVLMVAFPLVLMIGAGSVVTGKKSARICSFVGQLSFPLYITHYPLVNIQHAWVCNHPEAPVSMHIMVALCTVIAAIFLAYAAYRLYDLPVRAWLSAKFLDKAKKA